VIEDELNEHILRYFRLPRAILADKRRLIGLREAFKSQSYHTRMEFYPIERTIGVRAFRIEDEVCHYLEACQNREQRLKNKERMNKYFLSYLNQLTPSDQQYLYDRYLEKKHIPINEAIESALLSELHEIDDAIQYMQGLKPDKFSQVEDGTELDLDELLDVLEV